MLASASSAGRSEVIYELWHSRCAESGGHVAEAHLALIGGGDVAGDLVADAANRDAITHTDLTLVSGRGRRPLQ